MTGKAGMLACAACLVVGVFAGLAVAAARPEILRRLEKRLGLRDSRQQFFYSQNVAFHQRADACVPDGAVLFIGDSFIQGLCVTAVTKDGINYGIGGDTTEGLLARLPVYTSLSRARAVVFAIGDNDLRAGRTESDVLANYRKIMATMPKGLAVFFPSLTPCVDNPEHASINRGVAALNRGLKELCAAEPGCHFVDLNSSLSDERGGLRPEFAESDGVHLNGRGYQVCIEKLRAELAALN
jgi:lysophospholipase L1-like esterase